MSFLMKDKLEDAESEIRKAKEMYIKSTEEYKIEIGFGGPVDAMFRNVMERETGKVWKEAKRKKTNKIKRIIEVKKHFRQENKRKEALKEDPKMKAIKYKDDDLDGMRNDTEESSNQPRIYGGITLEENQKNLLHKNPKYMIHRNINELEMEVEIEKEVAKARYELMRRNEESSSEESEDEEGSNSPEMRRDTNKSTKSKQRKKRRRCPNIDANKVLQYSNLRATDFSTVPRLMEPEHGTIAQESVIERTKDRLLEVVKQYKREKCNKKGEIKNGNLQTVEKAALSQIKKDIKEKKMVVFTTDKSGRFTVDTPDNYKKAVIKHTQNDEEVEEEKKIKQIEGKINQHMKQFNKMFRVGENQGHEYRVAGATTSTNVPAPPLYGLRKDHKSHTNETEGPPVRPVCGANEAPNSRLSSFLSRIINDYADNAEIETECKSSEEMRAAFERFNEEDEELKTKCRIISMDVKALYPSMEWNEIIISVRQMIEESNECIKDVDWHEIGKYLSISLSKEEIEREGLKHVIPSRRETTGRKVSVAYLCNKSNDNKWNPARRGTPGSRQQKKMVAMAVAEGIKVCLANHVYKIGDSTFLQKGGGPIGLELTGAVSRAFMRRWDQLYLERVKKAGIKMTLYERYVDDSNQVAVVPPKGTSYDKIRKLVVKENNQVSNGEECDENEEERLARILKDIANSILPCVQMEADWPNNNEDGKLPILDMKVWTENGTIMYTHYEKPMANKNVIHNNSAHPEHCKNSVHVQEILRRIMNCSKRLDWEKDTAPILSEYMRRMKEAGYQEKYRKNVVRKAINIYNIKLEDERKGVRPIFRPKTWRKEERSKEKENKKKDWGTRKGHIAPIMVPTTPGGELAKVMQKEADKMAEEGIHFNIVEVGGRTLKSELQKSNPTETAGCNKIDCLACKDGPGKGGKCLRCNVNYEIECRLCCNKEKKDKEVYVGETSRNVYTRALEHIKNTDADSFMNKHMREHHPGEEKDFKAKVIRTNKDSLTRQVWEGVQIRREKRKLMNTKSEWFQPPLFKVQSEVIRE